MDQRDQAIVDAFTSFGESVDRIACFQSIRRRFFDRLPSDIQGQNHDDVVWRLLQLRKSGVLGCTRREG